MIYVQSSPCYHKVSFHFKSQTNLGFVYERIYLNAYLKNINNSMSLNWNRLISSGRITLLNEDFLISHDEET